MVATSVYNIVDTFWVARLGHEAIAALNIVFPYQILTIAVGIGTGVGMSALVSRRFGERNGEAATDRRAGFLLGLFWGLLFARRPVRRRPHRLLRRHPRLSFRRRLPGDHRRGALFIFHARKPVDPRLR